MLGRDEPRGDSKGLGGRSCEWRVSSFFGVSRRERGSWVNKGFDLSECGGGGDGGDGGDGGEGVNGSGPSIGEFYASLEKEVLARV